MGKPGKHRYFPPLTTLPLSSISVQSQQRKPIFDAQNPYFSTIFSENPYKTHTVFRTLGNRRKSRKIRANSMNSPRGRGFCVENVQKHDFASVLRRRRGVLRCRNRRKSQKIAQNPVKTEKSSFCCVKSRLLP